LLSHSEHRVGPGQARSGQDDDLGRVGQPGAEGDEQGEVARLGVALGEDKVYVATADAKLVALDQASGRTVWTSTAAVSAAALKM
jgi:outer membrane protein assembly factor BamB